MSDEQITVFVLLASAIALEAVLNPEIRKRVLSPDAGAAMVVMLAITFFILIAIAGPAPEVATGIAVLLLIAAIVNNGNTISALIQVAQANLQGLTGIASNG